AAARTSVAAVAPRGSDPSGGALARRFEAAVKPAYENPAASAAARPSRSGPGSARSVAPRRMAAPVAQRRADPSREPRRGLMTTQSALRPATTVPAVAPTRLTARKNAAWYDASPITARRSQGTELGTGVARRSDGLALA